MSLDDVPKIARGPGGPGEPLGRLGVLGDIHAEDERLEAAIAWLEREGAGRIVHVGDVADGRGSIERTLALLERHRIVGVGGNHERWFLGGAMRQLEGAHPMEALTPEIERALRFWPPLLELSTVRGPLLVCHGVGRDDMMVLRPDTLLGFLVGEPAFEELLAARRLAFVVAGHTHQPAVHRVGHLTWINAGTLKWDDAPVATLIDFGRGQVRFGSLEDPREVGSVEVVPLP